MLRSNRIPAEIESKEQPTVDTLSSSKVSYLNQSGGKSQKEQLEDTVEAALDAAGTWDYTPLRQIDFLYKMFFTKKFFAHRLVGLSYLIQYALVGYYYFADYEGFLNSWLLVTLPMTGVFQSITAMYTVPYFYKFTFLPRKTKDQGYFSDKYTMNYAFVVENSFFAMILLYQWLYYHDQYYHYIRDSVVVEITLTFFPYLLRQLWPK